MIRFVNATKSFRTPHGRKYVLRDVNLEIPGGVNVAFLGRNGAGKSTILRLLAGCDIPDKGYIETTYAISWPMGLAKGLQGSLTGRENARFVCRIMGMTEDEIEETVAWVHSFTELGDYFDMPIRTYSSGMYSRLNFTISMAFDFDCYIFDEIGAVGDNDFLEKSRQVLLAKQDDAIIIKVSHDMEELKRDCDVAVLVKDGRLALFDSVEKGIEAYLASQ